MKLSFKFRYSYSSSAQIDTPGVDRYRIVVGDDAVDLAETVDRCNGRSLAD